MNDAAYSQSDIAKKLMQAASLLSKGPDSLQVAMWHLCDGLAMIETKCPSEGKMTDWLSWRTTTTAALRSGIPGKEGTFKNASIREQITLATLDIGRERYGRAVNHISEAARMLVWVAGTKNRVLQVRTTPEDQARHEEGR